MRWLTINQAPPVGLCGSASSTRSRCCARADRHVHRRDEGGHPAQGENHNVYYEINRARRTATDA